MSLVSVIIPTHNSSQFISDTLKSIINQTYRDLEILITDDASTDNTFEIIKEFQKKDKRIKLYQLKKNRGAGVARNNSIKFSTGRYIAFCDSDDQWKENKIDKQIDFMKSNNLFFTYSSYEVIDEKNNKQKTIYAPEKLNYKQMLYNNYVGCLTAIYDQEKLGKIFMSKIRKRQDWTLWLKIFKIINNSSGIVEPLAIYRDRSNSISNNKFDLLKFNWIVYNKELGYNKVKSLIFLTFFLYYYARKKIFK
jgi:teichuronic acid biosynthesis glycosyltransferase TuaG